MADIFYQPKARIFSQNGDEVGAGYKFYFYQTGTDTPITTYSNQGLTISNTNPVVADAYGYCSLIYVSDFSLVKVVVKDADDNLIYTVDPVSPAGSGSVTLNDLGVRPTSYWGITAGTSSVYTLAANPTLPAYSSTNTFFVQPHVACAPAPTLNVDGLGALNLKKYTGQGTKIALQAGDWQASERYICINDGVDILTLNPRNTNFYTGTAPTLTIASGVVTLTNGGASYTIDTEGSSASDDLDTINGGVIGEIIILQTANSSRDVVLKSGTGNIVNPSGIDITLGSTNDRAVLMYDGSNWIQLVVNGIGGTPIQLLQTKTASASTSLAFTSQINSTFSSYQFRFIDILPAADDWFKAQISVDGGATYINANYLGAISSMSNADAIGSAATITSAIELTYTGAVGWKVESTSTKGLCGTLTLWNPSSTVSHKQVNMQLNWTNESGNYSSQFGSQINTNTTSAVTAIKFYFDSQNIASGKIEMYGIV